ncbi:hypothetical protein [Tychonema sp. LEGE 07203]|nr:hypothetical protein [Tychonema sp. LEGE 07203]
MKLIYSGSQESALRGQIPPQRGSPGFMVDTVSDTTVRDSVMPLE